MINAIDDYLIKNVFQKLTEKHQLRTSQTNFHLAIILFKVFCIIDIPMLLSAIVNSNYILSKIIIIFIGLILYTFIFFRIKMCKILNESYKGQSEISKFNPYRVIDLPLRIWFLILLTYSGFSDIISLIIDKDISDLLLIIRETSIAMAIYFMACVPATGSRLRELEKEKALNLNLEPVKIQI